LIEIDPESDTREDPVVRETRPDAPLLEEPDDSAISPDTSVDDAPRCSIPAEVSAESPLAMVVDPETRPVREEPAETDTDPPVLRLLEPARTVTEPAAAAASPLANVAAPLVLPPDAPVITLTEPVDPALDEPVLTPTLPLEPAVEPLDTITPPLLANDPPLTRDRVPPMASDTLELEPAESLTLLPAPLSLSPASTWMVPA
jgi:hypothetical protein